MTYYCELCRRRERCIHPRCESVWVESGKENDCQPASGGCKPATHERLGCQVGKDQSEVLE